ncbi:MAG: phosphoenolpyruvate kinase [Proteobacteria bacterium]|nr:phosphoenolpyruvate kinase [Pseudomonadota bacterium]MDA1300030.1 phosphoenolpyruvate kinase [Pseudomonadota bacterium]
MSESFAEADLAPFYERLARTNQSFASDYPGLQMLRQPVHTLYGGANLYKPGAAQKMADLAIRHVGQYAPTFVDLARGLALQGADRLPLEAAACEALGGELEAMSMADVSADLMPAWIAQRVYQRMLHKLNVEAVEDHRIDFEDGYGVRANEEEDRHAIESARAMASGAADDTLPPFVGIRIKALTEEAKHRAIRTLDLFVSTLASETGGQLPQPFRVTLPKVTTAEQVRVLADVLSALERKNGLADRTLDIEIMIETVQSILSPTGYCAIPELIHAGQGRVTGAILGTFDYTATCNIASTYQDHRHPAADMARHMMQLALTGTPVAMSDGITNIMPIAPHRGNSLTSAQHSENLAVVTSAWREHFGNVMHSLRLGFYQSWDLNPAQLPIRYAAVYYFFLTGLKDATERLRRFIDQAAQASLVGNTFDDAASAQGLLNFFISGISCGALSEDETLATGITLSELRGRSFMKIIENRMPG